MSAQNKGSNKKTQKTVEKTVSQAEFEALQKQLDDNNKNTQKLAESLQKEKDAHKVTAEKLHEAQTDLTNEMVEHAKTNDALVELQEDVKSKAATTAADENLKDKGISLGDALDFVSREVPDLDKEGKATGKMGYENIDESEVLSFKDHGDHVVVVTVSGEKIRGDK